MCLRVYLMKFTGPKVSIVEETSKCNISVVNVILLDKSHEENEY